MKISFFSEGIVHYILNPSKSPLDRGDLKYKIWAMVSKRYKEVIDRERHWKNGIKKWQSRVDLEGSEVIDKIPYELKDAVLGTSATNACVVVRAPLPAKTMDKLVKVASVRVGVSPSQLENIEPQKDGDGQSDFFRKALVRYPVRKIGG
jgi:hypothetical protein